MVEWPGRRGKLIKWKTPVGRRVNGAVNAVQLLFLWNLIPFGIYMYRKKKYNEEYLEGKRSQRFEELTGFESYCAYWGWSYKHIKQTKVDFKTFTIKELEVEEPAELLHQLPPSLQRQKDFEVRQERIEALRREIVRETVEATPILGSQFIFPANAIFEA